MAVTVNRGNSRIGVPRPERMMPSLPAAMIASERAERTASASTACYDAARGSNRAKR